MDIHDVIEAFVDGEPVDPVELEQALADPDGRAHLIDLVVLRKLVRRSHVAAPAAVVQGASPSSHRRLRAVAAAAVIAIGASVGGYFIGEHATTSHVPATASSSPGGSETVRSGPDAQPDPASATAPRPTVVIRFQPGVDWTEIGGH